jgi:hypothetical protein
MNDVIFHAKAFEEYMEWQTEDRKTLKKINGLIKDTNFPATVNNLSLFIILKAISPIDYADFA